MLLAALFVVVIVGLGTGAIFAAIRRHRTPPELRGDWWTPFEREFRAYARRTARRRGEPRRHRGGTA